MARLHTTAAHRAVLYAIMVITNLAIPVYPINVQMVQRNVREEYRRHVPAVYGVVLRNAHRMRFVMAVIARLVRTISMFMAIHVKITIQQTVDHMGIHAIR